MVKLPGVTAKDTMSAMLAEIKLADVIGYSMVTQCFNSHRWMSSVTAWCPTQ